MAALGWEADIAIEQGAGHQPLMLAMRYLAVLAALGLIVGCMNRSTDAPTDVCELSRAGSKLIGQTVQVRGWYGFAQHWAAIGSGNCRNLLIDPRFAPNLPSSFANPKHPLVAITESNFVIGLGGPNDYHANFTGILRKRDTSEAGDNLPSIEEMPYVLELKRIDDIRFERATFWVPPPPIK